MTEASALHDDRRLPALTGVRFFAAMTVLVSHFAHRGLILVPAGVVAFVDGGRTAVALFFVLSGFILAYNYSGLAGRSDRRAFYVNRIARSSPSSSARSESDTSSSPMTGRGSSTGTRSRSRRPWRWRRASSAS
jgi:hypothetical protein